MATEALVLLIRLNLAASAAIAMVFLLRPLTRRWFGAHQAYALWLMVPMAMAGAALGPTRAFGPMGLLEAVQGRTEAWLSADMHDQGLASIWALGLLASIGLVAWRYARFLALARSGRAGPAIVGIFMPRLVTPADFSTRFTPDERRLVRAHERAHMDRLDPRWNALVLGLQCLNWFNPLVHAAARAMAFDQELACDATVMARLPSERRRYAEALVRSQEATIASPLGCGWGGVSHPLVTRLTTLMQRRPADWRRSLGGLLLAVAWTSAFAGSWAVQPPFHRGEAFILVLDLTPPAVPAPPKLRPVPIRSR